jgi:hypothetical protein
LIVQLRFNAAARRLMSDVLSGAAARSHSLLSQKLLPVASKKNDSNILLNFHEHLTEVKLKSSMRSNHDELAVKYHAKIIGRTCTTALLQQPEPSAPAPPLDSTLQGIGMLLCPSSVMLLRRRHVKLSGT